MSDHGSALRFEVVVAAPVAEVYRAFTQSTQLREWLSDVASTAPRVGGRFYVAWNEGYYAAGTFTALQPDQEVTFTWMGRGEPGETQVRVALSPLADGAQVTLEHSGFGEGETWQHTRGEIERGWQRGLENLVSVVGVGPDLRITLRPMIGILFGEFTPEMAEKLGVPVREGVRLGGTLEGLGAHAAGLEKDDVLVELDGKPVKEFQELGPILARRRAGESLRVGYYRGAQKMEVEMTLGTRPIPEIPSSAAGLSAAVRAIYQEQLDGLEQSLAGVSDTEAEFRADEKEWNVKEVLAHLIDSERNIHSYISDLAIGYERVADGFGDNLPARLQGMIGAYCTLPALLEELKRAMMDTVGFLAALPDSFLARKGSYWRLAYGLLSNPYHARDHKAQIESAIQAARQ